MVSEQVTALDVEGMLDAVETWHAGHVDAEVRIFVAAEFAARLGRSPHAGRALLADAFDVRHRLARLWARVCACEVPVGHARLVAQQTRDLSVEAAGLVDAEVANSADGRLNWSRFQTLVAGKVAAADPERAAERERQAAEEEFARLGRSNEHGRRCCTCGPAPRRWSASTPPSPITPPSWPPWATPTSRTSAAPRPC